MSTIIFDFYRQVRYSLRLSITAEDRYESFHITYTTLLWPLQARLFFL